LFEYYGTNDLTFGPIAAHLRALAGEATSYETGHSGKSFRGHLVPIRRDGVVVGVHGFGVDVTDQNRAKETFALAQTASNLGTWDYDVATGTVRWSDDLMRLYGFEPNGSNESGPLSFSRFIHPHDISDLSAGLLEARLHGRDFAIDVRLIDAQKQERWVQIRVRACADESGKTQRILGTVLDVGAQPDRECLVRRLTRLLQAADSSLVSVASVGFDRIGVIVRAAGTEFGAKFVRAAADEIRKMVGGSDVVGCVGADGFAIVFAGGAEGADPVCATAAIADRFRRGIRVGDNEIFSSVSIGIADFPRDGADAESLLSNAETARFRAQVAGGNSTSVFSQNAQRRSLERLKLEFDLHGALERHEFVLHFQPIVERHGATRHFEALVRWQHPATGLISPNDFIELSEEIGLIGRLGSWITTESFRQVARWKTAGCLPVRLSINLSAHQLFDPQFRETVARGLEAFDLLGDSIEFEITENVLVKDFVRAQTAMSELRKLGVRFAIDDFGVGYSNLSQVKNLPFNSLKIDRTLIWGVATDPADRAIVGGVIKIAHDLGFEVVCEGVETRAQAALLWRLGCDRQQGFLHGRPVPAAQVERALLDSASPPRLAIAG
jgi:diguanylate cyclase (GGDEF)-like protein